jgi:tRNA U34 2-thiouridine synthase MnmA/TrmU
MKKNEFVCSICGEVINDLDEYLNHIKGCVAREKSERNNKRAEEVKAALHKVNTAKSYYEKCLEEFRTKYPDEYQEHFGIFEDDDDNENEEFAKFFINLLGLN